MTCSSDTRTCHLLLALWDGSEGGGPGGKADVIRLHQHDITSLAGIEQHRPTLDVAEDESDLVYHIACSRGANHHEQSALSEPRGCWQSRDDLEPRARTLPKRYDAVFQRMAEFNLDIKTHGLVDAPASFVPQAEQKGPVDWFQGIQQAFDHCDSLAASFQRRTLVAMKATLGSAVAAGLAFIIYADFSDQGWSIFVYFVLVACAFLSYRIADSGGWQRKYVDYRVLAEALRVQYFWALAGVSMDNPSRFSHDRFFNGRDLELGWIRNVLRASGLHSYSKPAATTADVELTVKHWVGTKSSGQLGYY